MRMLSNAAFCFILSAHYLISLHFSATNKPSFLLDKKNIIFIIRRIHSFEASCSLMKHLQQTTSEVSQSQSSKEQYELLCKAFEMFSLETSRLEFAYAALKDQFKELNLELQKANSKLEHKVSELDLITEYLKSILNNINQGILFVDLQGLITTYNQAAEAILGIKRDAVIFNHFSKNFSDEAFGFSMKEALASHPHAAPSTLCIDYTNPNGVHSELEVSTTLLIHPATSAELSPTTSATHSQLSLGVLIMIRDITDIRRLQLQASRNDRMKELGSMAAQMAHEIRNPLGGIKGFASLLKRDLYHHPPLQQMADYIVEGTDNLNRLVTQVLDYARPYHPHFEKIDLLVLLKEMQRHVLADENINKQNIEINIESSVENAWVLIDQQLFKSAILNLIVNAIEAMPQGGKLTMSLKSKRNDIILTISDTGIGISNENINKIFAPFFTTKPEGNGFGLAEVYKVIQAHEGSIDVSSIEGKGATFIIKLQKMTDG